MSVANDQGPPTAPTNAPAGTRDLTLGAGAADHLAKARQRHGTASGDARELEHLDELVLTEVESP